MPTFSKARAHARSTASSYGSSRRSNENERWNASNALSGSRSKRPPQRRSSLRSELGESVISKFKSESVFNFLQLAKLGRSNAAPLHEIGSLVLAAFGFFFRARGHRESEKIDKAFRVLRIVAAHREAGQIGAI